jgi:hypothetical protein
VRWRPGASLVLVRAVTQWRFTALLSLLLLALCVQVLTSQWFVGRLAVLTVFTLTIVGGVLVARPPVWVKVTVVVAAILGLAVRLGSEVSGAEALAAGTTILAVPLGLCVLVLVFRMLITMPAIGADAFAGAVFGYVLLAVVWALFFLQVETWQPGSFNLLADGGPAISQLLYFSLVTITTLGYGELTAATPIMRLCTALEAVQGTLYIAILIGRIAALPLRNQGDRSSGSDPELKGRSDAG